MRFTLKTRLLLMIAGTFAALAITTLAAIAFLMDREVNRMVRNDVQASGNLLNYVLSKDSTELTKSLQMLSRQPSLKGYIFGKGGIETPDYITVSDYAREWLQDLNASALVITDARGSILGQTDNTAQIEATLKREKGVAHAIEGSVWSGVEVRNDRLMLAVSVPVLVSSYSQGSITAYRAIDATVAMELKKALGTDIAFVNQGKVMGASTALPKQIPTPMGYPAYVPLAGKPYVALYASLPNTPTTSNLGFVTMRSYDKAIAPYLRFQKALLTILVIALVLGLAMGVAVARGVTQPLGEVVNAAQAISRGEWPTPIESRRDDEIGLLQRVFNQMAISLRMSQDRLIGLIDTDLLTGLDNHRRFHERLEQEVRRCAVSGEALSLLLIDVDHFQEYNRQYNHIEGDNALKQIAYLLSISVPEVAILARYGGEEFVALVPQQGIQEAAVLAEAIRQKIAAAIFEENGRILTVSVGCAEMGTYTQEAEGLVLGVELAVSRAKQLGRNQVCRFDSVEGDGQSVDPYQLHRYIKDGSLATIQALAAAVDAKDAYTQGHSRRVALYAAALARYVGLPKDEVDLIFTTGTLHDVGKIGVPDGILNKPGRLEDDERAIMETHPVLGEVIVRKVPQLSATLPGVRHHHERWDGKGYPDKLAGSNIPQIARILALADTFDAMTSDRPYRKGMGKEVALQEIARNSGVQFDPELAPRFVEMMERMDMEALEVRAA